MEAPIWEESFPAAVTICDRDGKILFMNGKARATFERQGGAALIGKSLYDCHSPASQQKLRDLLASGGTNAYTIEKAGQKKLIYQAPWYEEGRVAGLVEISMVIPMTMPHFKRD